jgi:hypothetical protein
MSFSLLESPVFILVDSRHPFGVILREQVKGFRIVSFVGNQAIKNNAFNQITRLAMVALLAAAQNKTDSISQSINCQVNLSRKAAARTP